MRRWVVLLLALSAGLVLQPRAVLCSETGGSVERHFPAEAPFLLKSAAEAVSRQLNILDRDVAEAARRLSDLDLKQDAARAVIRQLQERHADVVIDTCTVSSQGVMLLVEPPRYRSFEGRDISGQEQIKTLVRTRQPVMSRVFQTVEGVQAVDLEYPVIAPNGKYQGSVSAIFQPWVLIEYRVRDLVAGMPVEIWAMQLDGSVIYDADPDEVARVLFTDPKYQPFPQLLKLGRRIAVEPQGRGSYSYFEAGSSRLICKNAWWVSLGLHGTVWRLVSIHPAEEAPAGGAAVFSRQALRSLAKDPALIAALAREDRESALQRLRQVALTHTGVYSLSWIDARGVNRFGYPVQNSLFEVDLNSQPDAASVAIIKAIRQRRGIEYSGALVEGGRARYHLTPVLDDRKYLGSLLWIQKAE